MSTEFLSVVYANIPRNQAAKLRGAIRRAVVATHIDVWSTWSDKIAPPRQGVLFYVHHQVSAGLAAIEHDEYTVGRHFFATIRETFNLPAGDMYITVLKLEPAPWKAFTLEGGEIGAEALVAAEKRHRTARANDAGRKREALGRQQADQARHHPQTAPRRPAR